MFRRDYYEVLGLKSDCTQKEIRNAFVILSKECHPDRNMNTEGSSDAKSNQDFIQVMEAYQVLSKPHSRANYDLSMKGIDTVNYIRRDTVYEPWKPDTMSYSEKGPHYSPYYGVKGMKKVNNSRIVIACVLFCVFGALLQAFAIFSSSAIYRRDVTDKKSARLSANYDAVREEVAKNGKDGQLERMKLRLKKSYLDVDKGDF